MTFDAAHWIPVAEACAAPLPNVDSEASKRTAAGRLYYSVLVTLFRRLAEVHGAEALRRHGSRSHGAVRDALERSWRRNPQIKRIRNDVRDLAMARVDADYHFEQAWNGNLDELTRQARRAQVHVAALPDGIVRMIQI